MRSLPSCASLAFLLCITTVEMYDKCYWYSKNPPFILDKVVLSLSLKRNIFLMKGLEELRCCTRV
jgi:hypothetical protein